METKYIEHVLEHINEDSHDAYLDTVICLKRYMRDEGMSQDVAIGLIAHIMDTVVQPGYLDREPGSRMPAKVLKCLSERFLNEKFDTHG